jgi:hypothetical protein
VTDVKLIHVLLLFLSLLINIYPIFFMVISSNMLSQLSAIEPLNGGGDYGSWTETIEIALALWEIDFALTIDPPMEPVEPVIRKGVALEAFATRQQDFMPP